MAKGFNDLPVAAQAGILITVAVALAAGIFFYGVPTVFDSVWSLSAKKDGLRKEVDKLKAENQKNRVFEQQRTEYLNRIAQLEKQLETLRAIVPDEQATEEFMRMVYRTGREAGIFVRTFVAQPLLTRDYHLEMPFKLRLDGIYYDLLGFFGRLAGQTRIVSVTGLQLGPPGGGGMGAYQIHPSETVGANCIITTYFNKPQAPSPPPKK